MLCNIQYNVIVQCVGTMTRVGQKDRAGSLEGGWRQWMWNSALSKRN